MNMHDFSAELMNIEEKLSSIVKHKQDKLRESEKTLLEMEFKFEKFIEEFELQLTEKTDLENKLEKQRLELEKWLKSNNKLIEDYGDTVNDIEIKRKTKPNQSDTECVEKLRKKLKLYKTLTGITWNYRESDDTVKGVITNYENYVHAFNYSLTKDITERLWAEMYKATTL